MHEALCTEKRWNYLEVPTLDRSRAVVAWVGRLKEHFKKASPHKKKKKKKKKKTATIRNQNRTKQTNTEQSFLCRKLHGKTLLPVPGKGGGGVLSFLSIEMQRPSSHLSYLLLSVSKLNRCLGKAFKVEDVKPSNRERGRD